MGTGADVPFHPEHAYRAPYDAAAQERIAELEGELERLKKLLSNRARVAHDCLVGFGPAHTRAFAECSSGWCTEACTALAPEGE